MYKNFNLTDSERQQILENHSQHGYKKPINKYEWNPGGGDADWQSDKNKEIIKAMKDMKEKNPHMSHSEIRNALKSKGELDELTLMLPNPDKEEYFARHGEDPMGWTGSSNGVYGELPDGDYDDETYDDFDTLHSARPEFFKHYTGPVPRIGHPLFPFDNVKLSDDNIENDIDDLKRRSAELRNSHLGKTKEMFNRYTEKHGPLALKIRRNGIEPLNEAKVELRKMFSKFSGVVLSEQPSGDETTTDEVPWNKRGNQEEDKQIQSAKQAIVNAIPSMETYHEPNDFTYMVAAMEVATGGQSNFTPSVLANALHELIDGHKNKQNEPDSDMEFARANKHRFGDLG